MRRYGGMNKIKPKDNASEAPKGELEFILWKAELNKELLNFWKSMSE